MLKSIISESIKNRLKENSKSKNFQLNESADYGNIIKAVKELIGSDTGIIVNKMSPSSYTIIGEIGLNSLGALKSIFKKMEFKATLEKAPDGSNNFVVWNLEYSWVFVDGGRNGYSVRDEMVLILDGKVNKKMKRESALKIMMSNGWK